MSLTHITVAFRDLLKSSWMKQQAPAVVALFTILMLISYAMFVAAPAERRENRDAWRQLRSEIQEGQLRSEELQTRQVDRIASEFRAVRQEDYQLINSLLKSKFAGALKDISDKLTSAAGVVREGSSQ